jgi:O-antigen ligase
MFVKERKLTEYAVLLMGLSVSIGSAIALWQAFCGMIRVKSGLGMMDFAGIVGLIVPVLIVKSFDESIDRWKRNLFLFSAVLAMFALLFNQTRAVWVAILINCIIFVLLNIIYNTRKSRQAASTILVILAAISLFIATHQFTVDRVNSLTDMKFRSNHERIYMWNYAANVFLDHWDRGVGLAMLPSFAFSYTPEGSANVQITSTRSGHMHNNFLQLLAENGILGGIAYVLLFLRILKTAINHMNKAETRSWAMIAFLCTFEFLIHGMFDYTFSIGTIMFSYWFILGLSYVNFRETDAQPACAQ